MNLYLLGIYVISSKNFIKIIKLIINYKNLWNLMKKSININLKKTIIQIL